LNFHGNVKFVLIGSYTVALTGT